MAKTAVALYDSMSEAKKVSDQLTNAGFSRSSIQIIGKGDSNSVSTLTNVGLPQNDAEAYVEGVRRGGNLVMVTTDEGKIDSAVDIMDRHNSINIQERAEQWRGEGWGLATDVDTTTSKKKGNVQGETTIPVVEEELRVGKRQVDQGGVRVRSHVEERPVEETVSLREEHVNVERRPVNRAAGKGEFDTFKEGTVEFSEMAEEAVIDKQARVVEEVVISKDSRERQQKVRDTVRRTDVEVEHFDGDATSSNDFDTYRKTFRKHYNTNYASSGLGYDTYEPAYQYGYTLRNSGNMSGGNWNAVEAEARNNWERDNRGTWDRFKDAIRQGWESVTN